MEASSLIQIGVVDSTTVSLANTLAILELAEEDINSFIRKTGRSLSFEFIQADAEGDPAKALEAVQGFLSLGINLIVGPAWSSHCQACLSYANDNDMILFSGTSTSPLLAIPEDNLFRLSPTDIVQAPVIAKMMQSRGVVSIVVLRRGDAWSDGIFNFFESIWIENGFELKNIRYPAETSDFSPYLDEAESWVNDRISEYGFDKIGVLCLSFSEIVEMLNNLDNYSNLFSLEWFGSDGTALLQEVIEKTPEQANKIKLFSTLAAPSGTDKFAVLYDRYFERTNSPLGFYSANIYDICWIYALSVIACNTTEYRVIRNIIPDIANDYLGISGRCKLNESGDRYSVNYQIWGYGDEKDGIGVHVYGQYDDLLDSIVWEKIEKLDSYSQFERKQLSTEIDTVRKGIPLYESELVEFKQEAPKKNKLARIMTSFANTNGGSIYVGVTDEREIIGIVDIDQTQLTITNIARDSCLPPLSPFFTIIEVEGKNVIQVSIVKSDKVHKVIDGRYYCRIGPRTAELSVDELEKLFIYRQHKK